MVFNLVKIDGWIECEESRLIKLDACFEEGQIGAREYYARVDEFLAIHLRYDANDSVVIPELQHEIDHLNGTLYIDRMNSRTLTNTDNMLKFWQSRSIDEVLAELGRH